MGCGTSHFLGPKLFFRPLCNSKSRIKDGKCFSKHIPKGRHREWIVCTSKDKYISVWRLWKRMADNGFKLRIGLPCFNRSGQLRESDSLNVLAYHLECILVNT